MTIFEGLQRLRACGFHPHAILDVGAYEGWFARLCRTVWPTSYILMVDALPEKEDVLFATCQEIGNAEYKIALLGDTEAENVPFFVARGTSQLGPNQTGSSKYKENTGVPIEELHLPQETLDRLSIDNGRVFDFLKLDIQGAELEVLAAAPTVLKHAEVVLLEISLLEFNAGAPLIADVLNSMQRWGFILWDIADLSRLGTHLNQIDGLFVRPDSPLRLKLRR